MSFNKINSNSYRVGGKHYSATTNIKGDITQNKKTGMLVKLLRGKYVTCKRNKSTKYQIKLLLQKDWLISFLR